MKRNYMMLIRDIKKCAVLCIFNRAILPEKKIHKFKSNYLIGNNVLYN